jgi:hypothetical protein
MFRTKLCAGELQRFVVHGLPEERLEDLTLPGAQPAAVVLEQLHEDALGDVVGIVVAEAGVAADEVVDGGGVVGDDGGDQGAVGVEVGTGGHSAVGGRLLSSHMMHGLPGGFHGSGCCRFRGLRSRLVTLD